jgi:hypothetical protein
VDVSGRWPTDDDVREIARLVEEQETELPLDRADVYEYLADAALGFRPLPEALNGDVTDVALPVLIAASMLFAFRPPGQGGKPTFLAIYGEDRMKLAEALALRADSVRRVEQLRRRIVDNARFQEGEAPAEDAGGAPGGGRAGTR